MKNKLKNQEKSNNQLLSINSKLSKRSFSTNKITTKNVNSKLNDDSKQSNLLINMKSINPIANNVKIKNEKIDKDDKNENNQNIDKFNRVFNLNDKNSLINIIEDSENLMIDLQNIQNKLQDYKIDINSTSELNKTPKIGQNMNTKKKISQNNIQNKIFNNANNTNTNNTNINNNTKGIDYYLSSIKNLSKNDQNEKVEKLSNKNNLDFKNNKTDDISSLSKSSSSKFGEDEDIDSKNKVDLKLPIIANKSMSGFSNNLENNYSNSISKNSIFNSKTNEKTNDYAKSIDIKLNNFNALDNINASNTNKDMINSIIQEVKEQNKINTLYPLKAQEQMNKYKNNSNKLFLNKDKNKKGKQKKNKETFLTDIELLKKMEMNRNNNKPSIKEEEIDNFEKDGYYKNNYINEEDAFTQEYIKMHSEKNKEMFKYIDEETEIEKKYSKQDINSIIDELQLSSDENEDQTVKQGKKLLREIMDSLNTVRKLNKDKESELQAIIRITKDTSKNLDRHFNCINSIVKNKELGLNLDNNSSKDSDKNKKLGYDSIEENYSEEDEYERNEYRQNKQNKQHIPYNLNDDPVVLKKNLNIIKGNLMSVTGGVIEFHQNFQSNYKIKMNEKNKNK